MCLSRKTTTDTVELQEDPTRSEEEDNDNFLGAITTQQQTQWIMELRVNNVPVHFKIDTGAEVSAISEATFHHLWIVKLQ